MGARAANAVGVVTFGPGVRDVVERFGNPPDGDVVVMSLYRGKGLSDGQLSRLASEAKDALEAQFSTPFCRVNPETDLCDATHAALEVEREASLDRDSAEGASLP